jgi:biotin carboxyl carrier protein
MEYRLKTCDNEVTYRVDKKGDSGITLSNECCRLEIEYTAISGNHQHQVINGRPLNVYIARDGKVGIVMINGVPYTIRDANAADTKARERKGARAIPQEVTPPMPAVVVRVLVTVGDSVKQGQSVIVVESMKMETTLSSPADGRVRTVNVAAGDKVMPGQILVDIERDNQGTT